MTLMVDEQIKKRGYEPITQLFVPNSDLVETASYLANLDINKRMNRIYQMDIEDAIFDTRAFFRAFYKSNSFCTIQWIYTFLNRPFYLSSCS